MQASHLIRNCPKGQSIFNIDRARLYKHALGSAREIWQLAYLYYLIYTFSLLWQQSILIHESDIPNARFP